ncbi:MAG: sortase [Clostridia bacterium]|nr:sortase [Clostridia bacterium]
MIFSKKKKRAEAPVAEDTAVAEAVTADDAVTEEPCDGDDGVNAPEAIDDITSAPEAADTPAAAEEAFDSADGDAEDEISSDDADDGAEDAGLTEASDEEDADDVTAEDEIDEDAGLSDFERSIKNFSTGDIDAAVESGEKKRDLVRLAVLVLCACVFLYSTSYLVRNIHDKIKSDRIYADIIDSVADGFTAEGVVSTGGKIDLLAADSKTAYTPTMDEIIKNGAGEATTHSDHSAELAKMRASLESLRSINPDIYAWIKVPGTNINYPVAKTDNNEYYLDHAYTGDNLVNGSIYADFRCVLPITDNYNTVLYGHNVTSGSMFNHVTHFFKPEVFENTNIYVYTFDGIYIFKPFSIHEAAFDSGYVDMGFTGEEFVAFADSLAEMSDLKTDITFTPGDRLITLSTCTNGISTQRYALHGVLIETITE